MSDHQQIRELVEERWGIVLGQPIYEKDRLDPVDPAASLRLDAALLGEFPAGYRHLGYAQTVNGFQVKRDMPGLTDRRLSSCTRAARRGSPVRESEASSRWRRRSRACGHQPSLGVAQPSPCAKP